MPPTDATPNRHARTEREALCSLLEQLGPDVPTLCAGWNARDLAAHLVVREGRNPFASAGIVVPALASRTARAQSKAAATPWTELVARVRQGPPKGSMMRIAKLDGAVNTIEFFVHHEDLRRAQPSWSPRDIGAERQDDLWERLARFAPRITGKLPVGLVAARPDGPSITLHPGPTPVTITGDPGELLVYLYRRDHANVEVAGDPTAIASMLTAIAR